MYGLYDKEGILRFVDSDKMLVLHMLNSLN